MYAAHFGLKTSLFDVGIAQDAAVFRSAKREPVTANLEVAFRSPNAIVTLSGTAGVGKTTLISTALRASTTRLALAWLNGMPTNATELLELLLVEFGCNAHRATRVERLQMWRQFLSEMSATQSRVFVVVERTEDLAPEVLRALDALTAADTNGCPGANVVLLGNEGLDEHLMPPLLESLRQRIRLRQRLTPFTVAELEDYLRHHVTRAGGEFERLFAPGAVAALHAYSAGIARVANHLCDTALALAASEGQSQLTAELVATTAVGWFGCTPNDTARPTPSEPATAARPRPSAREDRAAAPPAIAAVPPAAARATAPTPTTTTQFDGGATDVPDAAMVDLPVLTDAVEGLFEAAPLPTSARAQAPAPKPTPAPPVAAAKPASAAANPAANVAATTPTASKPQPAVDDGDADELRQTQTMRAISVAKSIDDISSSMAETLFGEADLDMLSAALASAGWSPESTDTVTATPPPAKEPPRPKATAAVDDPFDLFDLGPDAPLELIDDSEPAQGRQPSKVATQR
jgi:general secretion pathway protein A